MYQKFPCGSINEARDFIRKYEGVDNFKIYGNTNFHYCFIADNFPNDIYYDINQISIANIDIETGSENGFLIHKLRQKKSYQLR